MPEFMMIICDDENAQQALKPDEAMAHFGKLGAWWEEQRRAGRITGGHKLQPTATARTVRVREGKATVTDGPFIESKEMVGGYGVLNVPDMQTAVDIASTWPGVLPITIEVRPMQVMNEQ